MRQELQDLLQCIRQAEGALLLAYVLIRSILEQQNDRPPTTPPPPSLN